ncbi:MAG: DUF6362 family protein [Rhodocyclaceae bacterium]|nr:DUF6362 family protein [Rhodocyclaceae bacterium]
MIDATDIERSAMRSCLRAFGEAAGDIGFDKPLGAYSEKEALKVIDAIVTRYTEAMVVHHAEVKYPPEQRHLVWMRANRYEWQQIGRRFACDRNTAARRWGKAIDFVVTKLNACLQR